MLNHPTVSKLHSLRLLGMATALNEQSAQNDIDRLGFDERFGLLVDREMTDRDSRRLKLRLGKARLRQSACLEDIDYRTPRGLDRTLMAALATGQWLRQHLNILITGKTGVGKSWIACALANQACRLGFSARYQRSDRLLTEINYARGDGRYAKLLAQTAKTDLLCIGDPTLADAILDRLVHNSYRIDLKGESKRRGAAPSLTDNASTKP